MKHKMHPILAFAIALILAPMLGVARAFFPDGVDAINIAGSHAGGLVTRITEVAFDTPYLLCRKGTAARQILLGTATARPIGSVADAALVTTDIGVRCLGGPETQLLIADGVISVDAPVYTAASGKVSATAASGSYQVGTALTATTADGQEIEVLTCIPMPVSTPAVVVNAAGATVSALQATEGVVLSNAGASGDATFALPAAVVGMRVTGIVEAAQKLILDPNGTETIALPSSGVQGAAGKHLWADAVGENVELVCLTTGTWDVINYTGTWTAES
ncbi:MAG: hypothetical protein WCP45_11305 [Verrucomicrobiota bacterium]